MADENVKENLRVMIHTSESGQHWKARASITEFVQDLEPTGTSSDI